MSKKAPQRAHQLNKAFDDAEREFGEKSTEFLAQIAADRMGVEPHDIYEAFGAIAEEVDGTLPFGYSDDKV